jgi:hypothetical protein
VSITDTVILEKRANRGIITEYSWFRGKKSRMWLKLGSNLGGWGTQKVNRIVLRPLVVWNTDLLALNKMLSLKPCFSIIIIVDLNKITHNNLNITLI